MTASSKPWGIVLEWDEDGLTCVKWAMHWIGQRLEFQFDVDAQYYIDHIAPDTVGLDVIATPRQFS